MVTQHTPGPWLRIDTADYAEIHAQFRPSSQAVALVGKPEDADLIAAAPDMMAALTELVDVFAHDGENSVARFDRLAAMFRNDTGYTAPGKDSVAGPVSQADRDGLNAIYDAWYLAKVTRARTAIARATGVIPATPLPRVENVR
jgi:hypothetical protein